MRRCEEAEPLIREALAIRRAIGNQEAAVANAEYVLARILTALGRLEEAESLDRDVLAKHQELFGADHPNVANAWLNLGLVQQRRNNLSGAADAFRKVIAIRKKTATDDPLSLAQSMNSLASVLVKMDDFTNAESLCLDADKLIQQNDTIPPDIKRESLENLRDFYIKWAVAAPGTGKMEKSAEWGRKLIEFDRTLEPKK